MKWLRKQETPIVSLAILFTFVAGVSAAAVSRATASRPLAGLIASPILAQTASTIAFPLPTTVPVGTAIRIGGSSSMETINQALKQRFEQQFIGTKVELNTQGTGPAIKDLLDGNADLAAIGRTLMAQEKAQGLVPVPVSRQKIAIIVGSENPFKESLTFEQFAKIFRGEIKDWAQIGGEPGPIRFIDRPDNSDTRQAFRNYSVFKQAPFVTGKTARQLSQDSTSQVVQALRTDGIGYAIADQLQGRGDVRVIPMYKTLPSNPKYPFSQPLIYAYKGPQPNPAAQAFLGYATAPVSRQTIETARKEATAAIATLPDIASPSPKIKVPGPQAVSPSAIATPQAAPSPNASAGAADPTAPWLWLLAVPLLGSFLWWLLRRNTESELAELEDGIEERMPAPIVDPASIVEPLPPVETVCPPTQPTIAPDPAAIAKEQLPTPVDNADNVVKSAGALAEEALTEGALTEGTVIADGAATPTVIAADRGVYANADDRRMMLVPHDSTALHADGTALASGASLVGGLEAAASSLLPGEAAKGMVRDRSLESTVSERPETVFPASSFLDRTSDNSPQTSQSQLMLIPRTAQDLYVHWDANQAEKDALKQQGGQQLVLRVYAVTGSETLSTHNIQQCFCNDWDHDQHVSIPVSNLDYVAELGYTTLDGRFLMLARSPQTRVSGA